jgi:enterochelin esterase family protein
VIILSKNLVSPVVHKDRSITFNLKSENAEKVEIDGDLLFGRERVGPHKPIPPVPMTKTPNNIWTITQEPVQPGIYRYYFLIDGIKTLDPLNPRRSDIGSVSSRSIVKVEAEKPMPWDIIPDITRGTVTIEKIYSETLNQVKRCTLYLPPSYPTNKETYSVLYLLHGGGDDYSSWIFKGNADNIMDFLISRKKTKEMVVVMPDGQVMTRKERESRPPRNQMAHRDMIYERHVNYLVNEVIPFIESRYRVNPTSRSIAGLSMGGSQSLNVAMNHPELFNALGVFSSGSAERLLNKLPLAKDRLKTIGKIYISGSIYDTGLEIFRALHKTMEELGIPHTYEETEDGGHIWLVWQNALPRFLSLL